jgi:hypothetical protein
MGLEKPSNSPSFGSIAIQNLLQVFDFLFDLLQQLSPSMSF